MGFSGLDPDVIAFYSELRADNTKEWWTANKPRYDERVLGPVLQLAELLHDEFGEVKIFRPYRDVRFSADKSPYKLHLGLVTVARPAHYLHLSDDGLLTGGGAYEVPAPALARFRQLVDGEETGQALDALLGELDAQEFSLSEEDSVRTAPRGYPADHPRIELLRLKRLAIGRSEPPADWMWTPEAGEVIRDRWRTVNAWNEWLDRYLGDLIPAR